MDRNEHVNALRDWVLQNKEKRVLLCIAAEISGETEINFTIDNASALCGLNQLIIYALHHAMGRDKDFEDYILAASAMYMLNHPGLKRKSELSGTSKSHRDKI